MEPIRNEVYGNVLLGDQYVYDPPNYQPISYPNYSNPFQIPITVNSSIADTVVSANLVPLPPKYDPSLPNNSIGTIPLEYTYVYAYTLWDGVGSPGSHNTYHGGAVLYTIDAFNPTTPWQAEPEFITISNGSLSSIYRYRRIHEYLSRARYYQTVRINSVRILPDKPNYRDLVDRYYLDNRLIPQSLEFVSPITGQLNIEYYRRNQFETIPDLVSIDWHTLPIDVQKDKTYVIPVNDIVLTTLHIDNADIVNQIKATMTLANHYSFERLFDDSTVRSALFAEWMELYNDALAQPLNMVDTANFIDVYSNRIESEEEADRTLRLVGANNNVWNNRSTPTEEVNPTTDPSHPFLSFNLPRALGWHITTQPDGSKGTLVMDSPRLIEIHKALDAAKYSLNTLDSGIPRVSNIGWYVYNIARVLGLRVDDNGRIDREKEAAYTRKILRDPIYNEQAYAVNCFGLHGRLSPHLTNQNGTKAYDVVYDIPQLLEALAEHQNRSLGIQQGTEVYIRNPVTGKEEYYPNQLAIQMEILSRLGKIQEDSKESYNLVNVIAREVRELFSGVGIPVMFKTLWTRYGAIPFIGHQQDKGSLSTSLATLKINVGMLIGNMLQPPIDRRNPIEKMLFRPKQK